MPQFRDTIELVVTVHEGEVAALSHENQQLRNELDDLRKRMGQREAWTWEASTSDDREQGSSPPTLQPPIPDETSALSARKEFTEPEEPPVVFSTPFSPFSSEGSRPSRRRRSKDSAPRPLTWRGRLAQLVMSDNAEMTICILVVCNAIVMAVGLQYTGLDAGYRMHWHDVDRPVQDTWPHAPRILSFLEWAFTVIFAMEVSVKVAAQGLSYLRKWDSYLDITVVVFALFDALRENDEMVKASVLRLLRLVKLARFARLVKFARVLDSLQLIMQAMQASLSTLFWSLLVLLVFQCVVGMTMCQILQPWFRDESIELARRQKVYRYYGTFTYAIITMFEVHLANWSPACRVLIDEVSQWYGLVLIIYRCLAGFAVLNVINAVFIQRTMKTAQSDEEYMLVQKEKEHESYRDRLQDIFELMDTNEDGRLSREEVKNMISDPDAKYLFGCMDMDSNDLEFLFTLFDDGDGLISADEFRMGTSRLRGPAKNVDMARLMYQVGRVKAQLQDLRQRTPPVFVEV